MTRYRVNVEVGLIFEVEAENADEARAMLEETWADHRPVDVAWGPDVVRAEVAR
jgi:hypothetical protein